MWPGGMGRPDGRPGGLVLGDSFGSIEPFLVYYDFLSCIFTKNRYQKVRIDKERILGSL